VGARLGVVPRVDHESENRRLKRELAQVTEERDIPEKGEPWFAIGSRAMANAYVARESQ
jgi:hypothetical protein